MQHQFAEEQNKRVHGATPAPYLVSLTHSKSLPAVWQQVTSHSAGDQNARLVSAPPTLWITTCIYIGGIHYQRPCDVRELRATSFKRSPRDHISLACSSRLDQRALGLSLAETFPALKTILFSLLCRNLPGFTVLYQKRISLFYIYSGLIVSIFSCPFKLIVYKGYFVNKNVPV